MQQALRMGQGKDEQQLQQTAYNLARQNGMNEKAFEQFVQQSFSRFTQMFGMKF